MQNFDNIRKYFWFFVYLLLKPFRHAQISDTAKKIGILVPKFLSGEQSGDLANKLALSLSYKVDSEVRFNMMSLALKETFAKLSSSQLLLNVADGSGSEFFSKNRDLVSNVAKTKIDYQSSTKKFAESHLDILSISKQRFFAMLFEDQPIFGLTEEFLDSSCRLLEDFSGLVDLVLIERACKYEVNSQNKTVKFDLGSLDFKNQGHKPLRVVTYGKYSFAILKNFHYKFCFNTLIANRQKYLKYLNWFTGHISKDNAHKIELASAAGIGPGFNFIAVPLEVFMLNIDYSHTQNSVRGQGGEERELFNALSKGYNFITS